VVVSEDGLPVIRIVPHGTVLKKDLKEVSGGEVEVSGFAGPYVSWLTSSILTIGKLPH
jgi:hypothetical protein